MAATLLGVLSALALPPIHALPVLLVAVPGLLGLIGQTPRPRTAFRRGLWFGFGHHLLGLYWITDAILVEAADYWWFVPIAVPGLSMVLAPFIATACAIARFARPGWRRVAVLAGMWVMGDLARQFIGTGFPWNLWGSMWAIPGWVGDIAIQPAAWVSVHGLTLLTIFLAAMPVLGKQARGGAVIALLAWATFGITRLNHPLSSVADLNVVLVQGNVKQGDKWDQTRAQAVFNDYLALTRAGVAQAGPHPALVVWPESSFPGLLTQDEAARRLIAAAARPAIGALIGSVRFPDSDGHSAERPRNSLVALSGNGDVEGVYDKWHLVPGGEYAPTWLPFAVSVVPGGGFARGTGPKTLHLPGLPRLAPLICYETIFPAQVIDPGDRPEFMVNITNDAWFGNTTGPRQHLAAARLRAVEEGLPLLRAANTGISAAFDADGRALGHLGLNQRGVLLVRLPGRWPATPFATYGLLIPFSLAVSILALAFLPLQPARESVS